jgi:hypothetical protein
MLQTGSPLPLALLWSCPGGLSLEAALHRRFATFRAQGEWFDLTSLGDPVQVIRDAVEELGLGVADCSLPSDEQALSAVPSPRSPQVTGRQTYVTVSDDEEWGLGELILRESETIFDTNGIRSGGWLHDRALSDVFPEKCLPAGLAVKPGALNALEADGWTLATLRNQVG